MKKTLLSFCVALVSVGAIAQDCNCMLTIDETFSVVPFTNGTAPDYRNDDGFTSEISLPFTFDLYGTSYTSLYINNNGNISFGNGYSTFVASGFPINQFPMISAYWADVDTRNLSSGLVYYKMTDNALVVRYNNVGYFPMLADLVNDFQLVISDGTSDLIPNGHNISFCYGDMQWSTGTAATVGANAGDGLSALQIGRFNAAAEAYDGPYANPDDVDFLDYSNVTFTTNNVNTNQFPINVSNYCDTIFGGAGDTLMFYFYDDIDQDLEYEVIDSSGYINPNDSIVGMVMVDGILAENRWAATERELNNYSLPIVISPSTPDGIYTFYINVTDNGTPSLTSTFAYTIEINATSVGVSKVETPEIVGYLNAGILQFNGLEGKKVDQFILYNSNGQNLLQTDRWVQGVNMNVMPSGVYIYTIRVNGQMLSGKIIK